MDNAELHLRVRIDRFYCLWEAFKPVTASYQDVFKSSMLKVCQDFEPELRAFGFGFADPQTHQLLMAFGMDAKHNIDRSLTDAT